MRNYGQNLILKLVKFIWKNKFVIWEMVNFIWRQASDGNLIRTLILNETQLHGQINHAKCGTISMLSSQQCYWFWLITTSYTHLLQIDFRFSNYYYDEYLLLILISWFVNIRYIIYFYPIYCSSIFYIVVNV